MAGLTHSGQMPTVTEDVTTLRSHICHQENLTVIDKLAVQRTLHNVYCEKIDFVRSCAIST